MFKTRIRIIGVNQYVLVPKAVLESIFAQVGEEHGPIPIRGTLDGHPFKQTLVKYSGTWRVYLNKPVRKAAGKEVGDTVEVQIEFEPVERANPLHPKLSQALKDNPAAQTAFDAMSPSRQKEIIQYINNLKNDASVEKNVLRTIQFLVGNTPVAGRDKT